MHLQCSSCVSFNQLPVHMLLLLLFISIMVTHRGYQQEQGYTVLGLGCILKWPLCAQRRSGANDPEVQQASVALRLLCPVSQKLESLSHTS